MPATTEPCPEYGNEAQQIQTEIVQNVVEPFGNQEIEDEVQYRICKTQDRPVVYFTDELDQQWEVSVIRERPNFRIEAEEEPYPLCYRFGYNKTHSRQDIEENDETNIADWITERVGAEECACRWKSPLGGCCLGNVRAAISEAQKGDV